MDYKYSFSNEIEQLKTGDLIVFRTTCRCMDDNHSFTIMVDFDTEFDIISMSFYTDVKWCDYFIGSQFTESHSLVFKILDRIYWYFNKTHFYKWQEAKTPYRFCCLEWKFARILRRIRAASRVLFTGNIELSHDFMFRGENHIRELARCINIAVDEIKKTRINMVKNVTDRIEQDDQINILKEYIEELENKLKFK